MNIDNMNNDGIVLLSKRENETSFSSLYNVKKAIKTNKVGHTGTLDSFASGLLVVCVGKMTKLVSNITEFSKEYEAIIKFGEETDTLELTGKIIKTTDLPTEEKFKSVLLKYKGKMLQLPPQYSAIHVNGNRASDLARKGIDSVIPKREINVFDSSIKELQLNNQNKVEYARIFFSVSKGTYIRSLARDIGIDCDSSAHLVGLRRYSVGNFRIEDAVGYSLLKEFTIENMLNNTNCDNLRESDLNIQAEIKEKIMNFNKNISLECNFENLIISDEYVDDFKNGKKILHKWFNEISETDKTYSIFTSMEMFIGLIEYKNNTFTYKFVIN